MVVYKKVTSLYSNIILHMLLEVLYDFLFQDSPLITQ